MLTLGECWPSPTRFFNRHDVIVHEAKPVNIFMTVYILQLRVSAARVWVIEGGEVVDSVGEEGGGTR